LTWNEREPKTASVALQEDYELAVRILEGADKEHEPQWALALFLQAAELGHPEACWQMGNAYCPIGMSRLYGVNGDWRKAHEWWLKAAELGHRPSMLNVVRAYSMGHTGGVPKDYAKAIEWCLALVKGNDSCAVEGMRELAGLAAKQKQWPAAMHWYAKAAKRGHVYALSCVYAVASDHGVAIEIDPESLVELDRAAARKCDELALCRLARRHEYGDGLAQDLVQAYVHYSLAVIVYDDPKGRRGQGSDGAERLDPLLSDAERAQAEAEIARWMDDQGED
jgi:TPR repeat protein